VSGATYEFKEIGLYGSNGKPDWFWDLNPKGTVPVLDCGTEVCTDSNIILDRIPQGLVAGGESLKASTPEMEETVETWRREINQMLPIGKSVIQGGRNDRAQLFEILNRLDGMVEGPYLCGDTVTLADCAAFPFLWRLDTELDLADKCPHLERWLQHCQDNNPAFAKTVQTAWWWWW
jgi:glutathione S-transferase